MESHEAAENRARQLVSKPTSKSCEEAEASCQAVVTIEDSPTVESKGKKRKGSPNDFEDIHEDDQVESANASSNHRNKESAQRNFPAGKPAKQPNGPTGTLTTAAPKVAIPRNASCGLCKAKGCPCISQWKLPKCSEFPKVAARGKYVWTSCSKDHHVWYHDCCAAVSFGIDPSELKDKNIPWFCPDCEQLNDGTELSNSAVSSTESASEPAENVSHALSPEADRKTADEESVASKVTEVANLEQFINDTAAAAMPTSQAVTFPVNQCLLDMKSRYIFSECRELMAQIKEFDWNLREPSVSLSKWTKAFYNVEALNEIILTYPESRSPAVSKPPIINVLRGLFNVPSTMTLKEAVAAHDLEAPFSMLLNSCVTFLLYRSISLSSENDPPRIADRKMMAGLISNYEDFLQEKYLLEIDQPEFQNDLDVKARALAKEMSDALEPLSRLIRPDSIEAEERRVQAVLYMLKFAAHLKARLGKFEYIWAYPDEPFNSNLHELSHIDMSVDLKSNAWKWKQKVHITEMFGITRAVDGNKPTVQLKAVVVLKRPYINDPEDVEIENELVPEAPSKPNKRHRRR